MEQLDTPAPRSDPLAAVSQRPSGRLATTASDNHPSQATPPTRIASTTTSHSVPSLRFPRPLGNRQLTNWVSSSQPDIMRPAHFQDDLPLDASITDGYEVIGTDVDGQANSTANTFDHQTYELGDDVQSLADTDTGTDAYTNDVDTDSSDDEEEEDEDEDTYLNRSADVSAPQTLHTDDDSHEASLETLVARSLEHPTELFARGSPRGSPRLSQRSSLSYHSHDDMLEQALSAAELARERAAAAKFASHPRERNASTKLSAGSISSADPSSRSILQEVVDRLKYDVLSHWVVQKVFAVLLGMMIAYAVSVYKQNISWNQNRELSTVPVASVSSITGTAPPEIIISTSTVTSTVTSTHISAISSIQTTSSSKSVAVHVPADADISRGQDLCSAYIYGRSEILLRVPQDLKSAWIAKQAFMISVSREGLDIPSRLTKITSVDEGFIIEIPHEEAHGLVDVSIATTRKPKISETFRIQFGRFMIVDALDAGKQLMKGLAQTVVDTVNGTTTWVEETCIPAFDIIYKPNSVPDSIVQGLRDIRSAVLDISDHVFGNIKQTITEERIFQARTEFVRQAQDLYDDLSLGLLRGQLNSKLWWLKVRGETAEYTRYLAAAEVYLKGKRAEAIEASRARGDHSKREIRARRKEAHRESRRPFWKAGKGGH
ncbi:hypothetical protein BX600DRAFT_254630 [Xylariales sp. PMI_506]|nr:hypothetical protein BX600DRAFT_254630 [Xylariales sp. PMI_506]